MGMRPELGGVNDGIVKLRSFVRPLGMEQEGGWTIRRQGGMGLACRWMRPVAVMLPEG